jgi:dipeptidyl aminopeptidase/acylaminoacyl peptidase
MSLRIAPPLPARRLAPLAAVLVLSAVRGDAPPAGQGGDDPQDRDRIVLAEVKANSEAFVNLTHLCDEIGPRLTGSSNLKRANEWAADRMKAYGLSNVHQEAWELPEAWRRGAASMRLLDPDTDERLTVASWGWTPGTDGKVQADVVALKAATAEELAQYKGKLKGAVVMLRAPAQLMPTEDLDKPVGSVGSASVFDRGGPQRSREEMMAFFREQSDLLASEGVAAVLTDSGKPFGLLDMTGGISTKDRPSATNRTPRLFVAHQHYAMLYRLATRPAPAKTRVELEVHNDFGGPVAVSNTIGELPGAEKPDEVVVVGAHLDSWDLGQGATDNGTGAVVVLETARALVKSGLKPRRTIRFILFTGEEQGLLGSKAYVEKHRDEMPKVSACLVHDTGTGKVVGFDAKHRPILQPLLQTELASLAELGVTGFDTPFISGSDHNSFEKEGVPGLMARQEVAGYRLNHHSPLDTLDRAIEPNLTQGAQVMAVAALRIADRDGLLPRDKPDAKPSNPPQGEKKPDAKDARRFTPDDLGKLVGVSEPRLSPDGKSVAVVVGRPNYDEDRTDTELVLVDVATGKRRALTRDRQGVGQPRWSPSGDRLAFLAAAGMGKDAKRQVFVLPMDGGDAVRTTDSPTGVLQYAWKPDGSALAYAAADEPENKKEIEKGNDAFEVGDNDALRQSAPQPVHVWLVQADPGGWSKARRLTSGSRGLATVPPPGPPASPLAWSPDGKSLAIVRQERPHDGDNDLTTIQIQDVETGKLRPLTDRKALESCPVFSPDGSQIAYWYPRDRDPNGVNEIWTAPATGGKGACLTGAMDRCVLHAAWSPDGKSLLVGGHDGAHVALWAQPAAGGPARKLDLGRVCPSWAYQMDAVVGPGGAVAFTASEPDRPAELYYLDSPDGKPRRLTDFNGEVAGRSLGKVETITWKGNGFDEDGVVLYPPDFAPDKQKCPLVLLIHGGPQSASVERFDALGQLIAAAGYIVFEPNYRGSDHRGQAYMHAIVGDWGKGPGEDVMAGLEALKKRGFVDEKRIAVTGWSYGGYMTTWLIGHYHDWKTAIAGAAVTDWRDMYDLSDGNVQMRYTLGGSPWTGDFERQYREQSPITFSREMKTPTLILSDTGDARVPIVQSYRLYHALKDNGVPVKFVAYPTAGHSPSDPVRQRDLFRRWVGWLDEQMR